ncbi:MAG TPA: chromosomal replication initiator DnaA [Xanthobacteraceae bacterium]|jgi:chromosomal replication initiation ATPase DnaA|nr:chromosomal replication initiator DnaA [Xanthobacteraceae bacterium]
MSNPALPRQLNLALGHRESFDRADFLCGPSNETALALIDRWTDWPTRAIALIGPEGSGKSHLAAVWAKAAGAQVIAAGAIEAASVPEALSAGAVAIEDADRGELDEAALFHLINLAREQSAYVLITARTAPAGWPTKLPDLASRLRALPVVTIDAPDDALLAAVLVKLFADRQLAVDERLIEFLLRRIERSFAAARAAVAELDREAMRLKRPVNRALAADVLRGRAP